MEARQVTIGRIRSGQFVRSLELNRKISINRNIGISEININPRSYAPKISHPATRINLTLFKEGQIYKLDSSNLRKHIMSKLKIEEVTLGENLKGKDYDNSWLFYIISPVISRKTDNGEKLLRSYIYNHPDNFAYHQAQAYDDYPFTVSEDTVVENHRNNPNFFNPNASKPLSWWFNSDQEPDQVPWYNKDQAGFKLRWLDSPNLFDKLYSSPLERLFARFRGW